MCLLRFFTQWEPQSCPYQGQTVQKVTLESKMTKVQLWFPIIPMNFFWWCPHLQRLTSRGSKLWLEERKAAALYVQLIMCTSFKSVLINNGCPFYKGNFCGVQVRRKQTPTFGIVHNISMVSMGVSAIVYASGCWTSKISILSGTHLGCFSWQHEASMWPLNNLI